MEYNYDLELPTIISYIEMIFSQQKHKKPYHLHVLVQCAHHCQNLKNLLKKKLTIHYVMLSDNALFICYLEMHYYYSIRECTIFMLSENALFLSYQKMLYSYAIREYAILMLSDFTILMLLETALFFFFFFCLLSTNETQVFKNSP